MATGILTIAETFVVRLKASPSIGITNIRRSHLTPVKKEDAPAIQVRADHVRLGGGKRAGCVERILTVRVALIVRADDALDAMDPLLEATSDRLDPETIGFAAYGQGVGIELVGVRFDDEIADEDALRCDLDYTASFTTPENRLVII